MVSTIKGGQPPICAHPLVGGGGVSHESSQASALDIHIPPYKLLSMSLCPRSGFETRDPVCESEY